MQTFKLKYEKPRKMIFDVYYDGKRIKNKKQYAFKPNTVLTLVELNELLYRRWWLILLLDFVLGLLGGGVSDFKEVRRRRKTVVLRIGEIISDTLCLAVGRAGNFDLTGTSDVIIESDIEEDCPLVEKRIKNYKKVVIISMPIILAVIFTAIGLAIGLSK